MERAFAAQLQEPSKSAANFVSLVKELAQNYFLDFDAFLLFIVHYMESGGTRNPFPDECFPLKVFAAMCSGISEKYKYPMLLMVAQLLDKACVLLNGKQKELIVDILYSCVPDILSSSDKCSGDFEHLKDTIGTLSNLCQVALCGVLKNTKLEGHCLFKCLSESVSDDLLMQTKEQWEVTCRTLHDQHRGLTAIEITLPYFCVRLSGATWAEWEILSERLVQTLRLSKGHPPTVLEAIRALTNCVAACAQFFHIGSWGYFFSSFAKVVKAQLQGSELTDCEVCEVIRELLLSLSVVPVECHCQGIILLLDVAQLLSSDRKDEATSLLKDALAAAESSRECTIAAKCLGDKMLRQISHICR
ncbi:uncharacterized protein LOC135369042 [Ornithodoros turicata]|uniref:uncharacterized protein LOC135369042 n=1 Tax=Ornithodoros turicata TaxID=34597 RepID=UPI0031394D60